MRLKYFKHLADNVKEGRKDAAVAYFLNPTVQIETWYKGTVDEYRSESSGETFARTFEQEFMSVLRKVENAADSNEIISVTNNFSAGMGSLYYQPSPSFSLEANADELDVMKIEIITAMKKDKDKFCKKVDDTLFSNPSADSGVMSRLGCTERCFWCGALCWGQRGHEANQGETKKHHSSHQPHGLAGVSNKHTCHLLSGPCHELTDDSTVYYGEYIESGTTWKVVREKHFSDWKFDKHCNSKFDALMRWFFQELHHSIAKSYKSLKPATSEDLQQHNCTNLIYDEIMSRVEQEIN